MTLDTKLNYRVLERLALGNTEQNNSVFTVEIGALSSERLSGTGLQRTVESAWHIKSTSIQMLLLSTNSFVGYIEARLVLTLHFLFFFLHVKLSNIRTTFDHMQSELYTADEKQFEDANFWHGYIVYIKLKKMKSVSTSHFLSAAQ